MIYKGIFWTGDRAMEAEIPDTWSELRNKGLADMLCVDLRQTEPQCRYGIFEHSEEWIHIPLERFPPKFRMHLLLLGVRP